MKQDKKGFSIRTKLLVLLVVVPLLSLFIYSIMAIDVFRKDKIAYVYGSTAAIAQSLAAQVKVRLSGISPSLRPIVKGFIPRLGEFSKRAKSHFDNNKIISYLAIYKVNDDKSLKKSGVLEKNFPLTEELHKALPNFLKTSLDKTVSLEPIDSQWSLLGIKNERKSSKSLIVTVIKTKSISDIFGEQSIYTNYLIDKSGEVIYGPLGSLSSKDQTNFTFFDEKKGREFSEGSIEILGPSKEPLILSYADVGIGSLFTVSLIEKNLALQPVDILLIKSSLLFLGVVLLSLLVSLLASGKLTSTLRVLSAATKRVAKEDYDFQVEVSSKDEVGELAQSFNSMTTTVSRLMVENVEKARMEKELETAKAVQETLFPESKYVKTGKVEALGFFEPASECSGDWWFYSESGDHLMLWIGDATGHGAPAALITSAARAGASLLERFNVNSPAKAMQMLNSVICDSSKGKVCMTFFIASINKKTGEIVYCNASHEPALLIPKKEGKLKINDLVPLMKNNNARLGQNPKSTYEESKAQLNQGDSLFLYTDGLTELFNDKGEMLGEVSLFRMILKQINAGKEVKEVVEGLTKGLRDHQNGHPSEDDITFHFSTFKTAA